jgi:hypothetical protein
MSKKSTSEISDDRMCECTRRKFVEKKVENQKALNFHCPRFT